MYYYAKQKGRVDPVEFRGRPYSRDERRFCESVEHKAHGVKYPEGIRGFFNGAMTYVDLMGDVSYTAELILSEAKDLL